MSAARAGVQLKENPDRAKPIIGCEGMAGIADSSPLLDGLRAICGGALLSTFARFTHPTTMTRWIES
ncbi:hypothetical protein [Achromobacter spanius]|uniref:hypothetical protein n=1 Tax=Achromobacter spanius TaxID=217203 RepID=UPI003A9542B9